MAKLCAHRNGQGHALSHPISTGRGPALSAAANYVTAIFNGEPDKVRLLTDTKTNLQGSSKYSMDWLNVGSNGFAQVGSENYFAKNKVEMKYLLELIRDKFPIPEELKMLCRFAAKSFPHDFGTYHEIVLHFDDDAIGDGYDEEDADAEASPLHDIFWDWFHQVEAFDIESEEITQAIKTKYLGTMLDIAKGEHLSIVPKKLAS